MIDASAVLRSIAYALSPAAYIRSLGFGAYPWQEMLLESPHKRKLANGARQSGKSTIVSGKACHTARFVPGSLSMVVAATEKQAVEDMDKIKDFIGHDPDYPRIVRDSDRMLRLANGSSIEVVPATDKAARGKTRPRIIVLDEASRIDDVVFKSGVRPMLNNNPDCEMLVISTPNGRTGFFWTAWNSPRWERYLVRSPWDVDDVAWRILDPSETERQLQRRMAKEGIHAWHSPEHMLRDNQQEHLDDMGPRQYRQEMRCEFVEPEFAVFPYDHIDRAFANVSDEDEDSMMIREDVEAL